MIIRNAAHPKRPVTLARPPWDPAYDARCGYGSQYMTAHGRTLCKRISRCPNQGRDWRLNLLEPQLATTEHRSATKAAARQGCAYDFLSPDMLRNDETGRSKGSQLKGWIESSNALR